MIPCQRCGLEVFLLRGLCVACDPEYHREDQANMLWIGRMGDQFKAATGKDCLADWLGFESWLAMHGEPMPFPSHCDHKGNSEGRTDADS